METVFGNLTFKGDQAPAFDAVMRWYNTPAKRRKQVFKLYGGAGVGKTTIAKCVENFASVHYMAYSGKAALVMRKKGATGAATIHSSIYELEEGTEDHEEPKFRLSNKALVKGKDLLVVDEASMVDEALGEDILSYGIPVLVLGDPYQLQPVGDKEAFFTKGQPDFLMEKILRQAEDSPIIRLAYEALHGKLSPGEYGESRVYSRRVLNRVVDAAMLEADQILVGKNMTRNGVNSQMRRALGRVGKAAEFMPVVGDRLICLKNNRLKNILNGEQFVIEEFNDLDLGGVTSFKARSLDREGALLQDFEVPNEFWKGTERDLPTYQRNNFDQFAYAYGMTVHKAQGSQWDHVMVLDESHIFREEARNHLYTAITRAAEVVKVFL